MIVCRGLSLFEWNKLCKKWNLKKRKTTTHSQNGTLILYQNLNCIPVQYVKNGISKRERPRHTRKMEL
jgi:hypothetical protein